MSAPSAADVRAASRRRRMTSAPDAPAIGLGRGVSALAFVGAAVLVLPLVGLALEAPWSRLPELLTASGTLAALRLSLVTASIATGVALVLGVPLAFWLARSRARWVAPIRALVTVPVVLPPVVAGVALLLAFGEDGIAGSPLYDAFGVRVPATTAAVILAETFVAMPYLVIAVEGALRSVGPRHDAVAASLGAGPLTRFARVSLPIVAPAIWSGAALCWGRALGEFGATMTFAGSVPGITETLPLRIYAVRETDPAAAAAIGLVLVGVAVVVLVLARRARPAWSTG